MSLNPSFTTEQNLGASSILILTDTSTGSDGAITERRVYLRKSDGTYLVPSGTSTNYIVWDYADDTISLDVLDKDYALEITVLWVNSGGTTLYSDDNTFVFTLYAEEFYYGLTQELAGNYPIIADDNYYSNKFRLRTEIDSANNAISIGGDIAASQACLDRAKQLIDNQSLYF